MNYLDLLPLELLRVIAADSEPVYSGLIRAYPRFARGLSIGDRVDFRLNFGHTVKIRQNVIIWTRNGRMHRLDGPAVEYHGVYELFIDGFNSVEIRYWKSFEPYALWLKNGIFISRVDL